MNSESDCVVEANGDLEFSGRELERQRILLWEIGTFLNFEILGE